MNNRRLAFVIALVVITLIVSIQLLDPQLTKTERTPIEFDSSPATVAETAVQNLTQRDYTYTMLVTSNRTPESRMDGFYRRVKVENTDEEYYVNVTPSRYVYANNEVLWVRNDKSDSWKFGMRSDYTYPAGALTNPFSLSKIENASGEIVAENNSTLVVRLDNAASSSRAHVDLPGDHTLLYIDKSQKRISRTVFVLNNTGGQRTYIHLRVTAVDETNVQRPSETRPSVKAFLLDILRGPLFRVP